MKKRNMAKWYLPVLSVWAVLLVVVAVVQSFNTSAKYTMTKEENAEAVAKAFYFESDLLDGGTHTLQDNATSLSFSLMNYPDSLRTSEVDINYSVTLDGPVKGSQQGILLMTEKTKLVTFDGLKPGEYTVTATATSPYAKTLTGTFEIPEKNTAVSHSVSDGAGNPVCYLTISVGDYSGDISVTPPGGVELDPNQQLVLNVTPNTEYRYTYFKLDPNKVYTNTCFAVAPKSLKGGLQ